jgi:hypothetical protein
MLRGRVLPRKFKKFYNWGKPSPRYNLAIMQRTITVGISRKIGEIEASSMGVETLRYGGTLHTSPLVATQKPGITNKRQTKKLMQIPMIILTGNHY